MLFNALDGVFLCCFENILGVNAMPFYRVSLKSLRRVVQAVADANPSLSPEPSRVSYDAPIAINEASNSVSYDDGVKPPGAD